MQIYAIMSKRCSLLTPFNSIDSFYSSICCTFAAIFENLHIIIKRKTWIK